MAGAFSQPAGAPGAAGTSALVTVEGVEVDGVEADDGVEVDGVVVPVVLLEILVMETINKAEPAVLDTKALFIYSLDKIYLV